MEVAKFAFQFTVLVFVNILIIKIFMELARYIGDKFALAEIIKGLWMKVFRK